MSIKRTLKERKFIAAYIDNNGNATQAYLSLHPKCNVKSAGDLGYRMLKKVDISNNELMNLLGITDKYLQEKLDQGLNATKTISVIPIKPIPANPNSTDLPDATSKNLEFVDVDDFAVRQRYLDMAFKLKGKYPATKLEVEETKKIVVIGEGVGEDKKKKKSESDPKSKKS